MQVENYIQGLLYEHNFVVIPDFGGFIAEYKSVEIHPITHRFNPPTKRIAFNEQLKVNDGLLAATIAREEKVSLLEAYRMIRDFVFHIREELQTNNNYVFQEIGKLFYNIENRLEFEPDTRVNYLDESFGFHELFFKPIERNYNDMSTPQRPVRPVVRKAPASNVQSDNESPENKKNKKSPLLKTLLIIVPLLLLVTAGGMIVYTSQTGHNLAGMNIFGSDDRSEDTYQSDLVSIADSIALADSLAALVEAEGEYYSDAETTSDTYTEYTEDTYAENRPPDDFEVEENPAKQTLIEKQQALSASTNKAAQSAAAATAQHGRFFVVVGSFKSKENAYKLREQLASLGGNATVLEPSSDKQFYKVSADDFANMEEAMQKRQELISEFGPSVWVMNY
jgi:cell division protein FtsN